MEYATIWFSVNFKLSMQRHVYDVSRGNDMYNGTSAMFNECSVNKMIENSDNHVPETDRFGIKLSVWVALRPFHHTSADHRVYHIN